MLRRPVVVLNAMSSLAEGRSETLINTLAYVPEISSPGNDGPHLLEKPPKPPPPPPGGGWRGPPRRAEITPRRRRRSPESAEREILAAAESFLRERPFHEMTVDEVMGRTTLSRPSFYVYFPDRNHLVIRLVDEVGAEVFAMAERW